ncbi:MAG: phosphotransferase [Anaerolineaceae bacterium]|nr:phosphotransferase [Anaerolineaceae bacterium]
MTRRTGLADLHMHTTTSDGWATVTELLDYVRAQGRLDVIAITDHDRLEASLWAYEHRARYPFDIVPGVEVSSRDGHVLALWVTKPIPRGLSLQETVAAIHEQNGLAVLAHPFEIFVHTHMIWRYLTRPEVLLETEIDAIEVHNSGAPTPGGNWLARSMAEKIKLPMTGSSDAHTLTGIGCGITRFEGQSAQDLRRALVNGTTIAEGVRWPIVDYLRLLPASTQRKLSASLGMSTR